MKRNIYSCPIDAAGGNKSRSEMRGGCLEDETGKTRSIAGIHIADFLRGQIFSKTLSHFLITIPQRDYLQRLWHTPLHRLTISLVKPTISFSPFCSQIWSPYLFVPRPSLEICYFPWISLVIVLRSSFVKPSSNFREHINFHFHDTVLILRNSGA